MCQPYVFVLLGLFGFTYSFDSVMNNIYMKNHTQYALPIQKHVQLEKYFTALCLSRWAFLPILFTKSSGLMTALHIAPVFAVGGFYLAFFFVLSHNYTGVFQYDSEMISEGFLRRQVKSSSNVGGELLCFMNGGLYYQIEHHLFPRISHCH